MFRLGGFSDFWDHHGRECDRSSSYRSAALRSRVRYQFTDGCFLKREPRRDAPDCCPFFYPVIHNSVSSRASRSLPPPPSLSSNQHRHTLLLTLNSRLNSDKIDSHTNYDVRETGEEICNFCDCSNGKLLSRI